MLAGFSEWLKSHKLFSSVSSLLVIVAVVFLSQHVSIDLFRTKASTPSGPNAIILFDQNLEVPSGVNLSDPTIQRQILANVKAGYEKEQWDLLQLEPTIQNLPSISPERASLFFQQNITGPNGTKAPVEGGFVSMVIREPDSDGNYHDILTDSFIPGVIPQEPQISSQAARQAIIPPLDAEVSEPILTYHYASVLPEVTSAPQPPVVPTPSGGESAFLHRMLALLGLADDEPAPAVEPAPQEALVAPIEEASVSPVTPAEEIPPTLVPEVVSEEDPPASETTSAPTEETAPTETSLDVAPESSGEPDSPLFENTGDESSNPTQQPTPTPPSCDLFCMRPDLESAYKLAPKYHLAYRMQIGSGLTYDTSNQKRSTKIPQPAQDEERRLQAEQEQELSKLEVQKTQTESGQAPSWSPDAPWDRTNPEGFPLDSLYAPFPAGDLPMTIYWKKNGVEIPGTRKIFQSTHPIWLYHHINNVSLSDAGSYSVVATNALGSATSREAQLTINPTSGLSPSDPRGITGYYFNNTGLNQKDFQFSKKDKNIEFDWKEQGPTDCPTGTTCKRGPFATDTFSTRWYGQVHIPLAGLYCFGVNTDDGARLWVDGELLIDNWQGPTINQDLWAQDCLSFNAQSAHTIRMEYWEGNKNAHARLIWRTPGVIGAWSVPEILLTPLDFVLPTSNVGEHEIVWVDASTGQIIDRESTLRDFQGTLERSGKVLAALDGGDQKTGSSGGLRPASGGSSNSFQGEDGCVLDSYFASLFYDNPDLTDATSTKFLKNIQETWSTGTPPADGITPDNRWGAKFAASFIIGDPDPSGYNYLRVDTMLTGTTTVFIDGSPVLNQNNPGSSQVFQGTNLQLDNTVPHEISVIYANDNVSSPRLEIFANTCAGSDPTNCNYDLFFAGAGVGESRPEKLYFTQKPRDISVSAGANQSAQFSMNYANTNPPVTIQWQKKNPGYAQWNNVGQSQPTYTHGPPTTTSESGTQFRAQISNGLCQLTNEIKNATLTVSNDLVCEPSEQDVVNGERVVFTARNFTSLPNWQSCGDPGSLLGNATYEATYSLGRNGCAEGSNEVRVTSGNQSAVCTINVLSAAPTPTPGPSSTPTPTPQVQRPSLWVYDNSPIDQGDCQRSNTRFPTPAFPGGECDPHKILPPEAPPVTIFTGIGYLKSTLVHAIARDPSITVTATEENNEPTFHYPSIFADNGDQNFQSLQVGQVNAYRLVMNELSYYINNVLPFGTSSTDPYSLPQSTLGRDFALIITVDADAPCTEEPLARHLLFSFELDSFCGLDREVITHEFNHAMLDYLAGSKIEADQPHHPFRSISEGVADYFSLRIGDAQYAGDYYARKLGLDPRPIFALSSPEIVHPLMGGILNDDPHIMGAKVANILMQMRNYLATTYPNSVNTFDRSVLLSALSTGRGITGQAWTNVNADFYIKLLDRLRNVDRIPSEAIQYFRDDLLFAQAQMEITAADYQERYIKSFFSRPSTIPDPDLNCTSGPAGRVPILKFTSPPIIAIDSKLQSVDLELYNQDRVLQTTIHYDATTTPPLLSQPNSPSYIVDLIPMTDIAPGTTSLLARMVIQTMDGRSRGIDLPGSLYYISFLLTCQQ